MNRLTKLALLTPLAAAMLPGFAMADASSEISALRERLEQLEAQVAQQKTIAAAPAAVAKPSTASALQIGDTKFSFGGYIRVDAAYSSYSDGEQTNRTARDIYLPSTTPIFNTAPGATNTASGKRSSVFDMHAKTTRINMKTTTDAGNGQSIGGFIEFDFLTGQDGSEVATNRYEPTLRHAFITYDKWLIGQTWTVFQDLGAFPDTVEFVGATDGTTFGRQPQVRYTDGNFQFSLENPQSVVGAATAPGGASNDDSSIPDFVARYTHKADFGHISVAALARQLKNKTPTTGGETSYGGGVTVSGKVKLTSHDDIRFMATYGTGIGRYVALGTIADAKIDAQGNVETNDVASAYVTYHHMWNDKWRSNIQLSGLTADYGNNEVATDTERSVTGLVNVIYKVAPKLDIGVEYLRGERTLNNGDSGTLDRVMGMAKYSF